MSDERVWLRHTEHGGSFHAPAGAVDALADLGWVPADPPQEHNPVVAENLAAQAAAPAKKTRTTDKE